MNENLVKDELKVKRKNAFRELLKESNVNVTSNWKEIRRKIKDDVRYQKYRHSLPNLNIQSFEKMDYVLDYI